MLKEDFELRNQTTESTMTLHSSRVRRPLSVCILRPKPEPTETYLSAASPNGETLSAFPTFQKNDELDSKAQHTSEQLLKTEQDASVSPSDERCRFAIGIVTPPSVTQQEERPHACDHCGKSFPRRDHLQRHIDSVHLGVRPHACDHCGKSFPRKSHLRRHISSVHWEQRPHPCEDCGRSYSEKRSLQGHVRSVHLNERPHECKYCEKTFSLSIKLRVHEKSVHLKQQVCMCGHCGKSFSAKGNLQRHLISAHSTQRPYTCERCGKSFSEKCNMRKHLKSVHSKVEHSASNGNTVAEIKLKQDRKVQVPS